MSLSKTADLADVSRAESVVSVHARHSDFVWLSLQRLGIPERDLEDVLQEVFVVVHRKLHTFDGSSKITTWLFGICLRLSKSYRRRAWFRRERFHDTNFFEERAAQTVSPEERYAIKQKGARLTEILNGIDPEKRAVFVMFEVDELSCEEIAETVGIPVGTVYSRLHSARKRFARLVERGQARQPMGAP